MTTPARKIDPKDARHVRHTRMGIWDLYEDRKTDMSPIAWTYAQIVQSVPYVSRTMKDILSIRRAWMPLSAFLLIEVLASLIPAVSLWYTGQLFSLVETGMETRTAGSTVLVHIATGRLACTIATSFLQHARRCIIPPLYKSIKAFHRERIFNSLIYLDLPTYEESVIAENFRCTSYTWVSGVAFETVEMLMSIATTVLRLLSQCLVLIIVLREQQDVLLFAVLSFLQSMFYWYGTPKTVARSLVWAAATVNEDYVRMLGLYRLIENNFHRKELVAGNLSEYVAARFHESAERIGDDAVDFSELEHTWSVKDSLSIASILREMMHALPPIFFTLRIVQKQMTIPLYLVSLMLIYQISFGLPLPFSTPTLLAAKLADIRSIYAIDDVKNKVVDGLEPFPEDRQSLRSGISIEFRNVSFQYPGAERYALRNVSFKIEAGRLCVIIGMNGSGKSTILNLISRIYDPTEGIILIDNRDIKSLRLADLRTAMSILFQDFTHFPLSIRENVGLGNPALAHDNDKIREAARLGGAEEFVDELLDGFNSYLERPVNNHYAQLIEGTMMASGQRVDFSAVKSIGGLPPIMWASVADKGSGLRSLAHLCAHWPPRRSLPLACCYLMSRALPLTLWPNTVR
ncbi:uncharacterized protein BJ212DRAFT_1314024 [Suillus subaureus]|uniref:ABC transporter domain-containing protein n=1 Tax=Suillus subaureus TaxID=48587 RepID=A0A9P7EL84_9AGAM|nr:uncharacterized protein BJ212DRAFT_1314024 [Suillus subaureus]KAG1825440.1 hypothetical protein BJ212DRAFT_1314024 [Suillus subaureus]